MITANVKPAKDLVQRFYNGALQHGPRAFINVDGLKRSALRRVRELSPKASGEFRAGWSVVDVAGTSWNQSLFRLVNNHPAALAIEYGSRGGQVIVPRRARALAFTVDGKSVVTKKVIRGATRAHGVLRRFTSEFPGILKKHLI